ncbi:BspA family leucine-rich repeat surface protein [Myroides marinus]|uniref:BspA family leucine-rich repeat surface protein n=1 Tax=Myroides marinus TaxID=703342 RepID=UPI002574A13D|nr:BspA family leucine-rich repeat surface protein [Myroides marinus]MDM1502256.1 BspA family leucine-rich repeat surface protein [Myroides marinus]
MEKLVSEEQIKNLTDAFATALNQLDLNMSAQAAGFKGVIVPSSSPVDNQPGVYICDQAGTYKNFGGIVVTTAQIGSGIAMITVDVNRRFELHLISLAVGGQIANGDNRLINGDTIAKENYVKQSSVQSVLNTSNLSPINAKAVTDKGYVQKTDVKNTLNTSDNNPINSQAVIDKGYVQQSKVLSTIDVLKDDPINSKALIKEYDKIKYLQIVNPDKVFSAIYDTTKISSGSSDEFTLNLPFMSKTYEDLIVDWGDGTKQQIFYGLNTVASEIPKRNLLLNTQESRVVAQGLPRETTLEFVEDVNVGTELFIEYDNLGGINVIWILLNQYIGEGITNFKYKVTQQIPKGSKLTFYTTGTSGNTTIRKVSCSIGVNSIPYKPCISETNPTHTYTKKGEYLIQITGTIRGYGHNNKYDILKIGNVLTWGNFILDGESNFWWCNMLDINNSIGKISINRAGNSFMNVSKIKHIDNLGNWDTSNLTQCYNMFSNTPNFDGIGIENWNFEKVVNAKGFMHGNQTMSENQYEKILRSIKNQNVNVGVEIDFGKVKCNSIAKGYKDYLTNVMKWTIIDGGNI